MPEFSNVACYMYSENKQKDIQKEGKKDWNKLHLNDLWRKESHEWVAAQWKVSILPEDSPQHDFVRSLMHHWFLLVYHWPVLYNFKVMWKYGKLMTSCKYQSNLILTCMSVVTINLSTETFKANGLNCIWLNLVLNYLKVSTYCSNWMQKWKTEYISVKNEMHSIQVLHSMCSFVSFISKKV